MKGKHNPADIHSRGMSVKMLSDSEFWWHGPEYLKELSFGVCQENGEEISDELKKEIEKEVKKTTSSHITEAAEPIISPDRYSSIFKL